MKNFFIYTSFLLFSIFSFSQSDQEKLEQRKAQIQEEIKAQEELLKSKTREQKSLSTIIAGQTVKIKLQEKLINTTEKQANVLKNNMYINQININQLKKELVILKEDYAKMIVKSYKSRSQQSRAMFLLSSKNFLQAYKRAQYMKQYASYRKHQSEEIQKKSVQLANFNSKLNIQKTEKQRIIEVKEKERLALEQSKKEQEKLVQELQKDKKKIIADINKKQKETKAIDKQINRLIREAIVEANRRAAEAKRKANPKKTVTPEEKKATETSAVIELTPESKIIADNFKANKGRLPWPVEKGSIYQGFGDRPHPVYKQITVHNSGVDIETEEGANARAVFGGLVTKVIELTPVNKAIFIQHGDYFTVYQNLISINVTKGDKVSIKQNLGKVRTNGEGKTILKFMILQNTTPNNPSSWLGGK